VVDGAPAADRQVAFLPVDNLGSLDRTNLRNWVRGGGILVVADPQSSFVPRIVGESGRPIEEGRVLERGNCTIAALAGVDRIEPPLGLLYRVPTPGSSCFGVTVDAFVVARDEGAGTVVSLGGPSQWFNANLGRADNAALAVSLLAPKRGTTVAFVRGPSVANGDETLWSIIRPGIRYGFLQLALAFLVFAGYRARRLGRPVLETPRIEIEGSELVVAVGNLLSRADSPGHAGEVLRRDARRELGRGVGAGPAADHAALVAALATSTGVDRDRALWLLGDAPVEDEAQLVELARQLQLLHEEVLRARG
jgi:hypothetical protein